MDRIGIVLLAVAGLSGVAWGWANGTAGPLAGAALALGGLALGVALARGPRRRGPAPRLRPAGADPAELAVAHRELEEARAELDAIHSSVSHDLRSPIGATLNFLTVLEEDHGAQLDADGRAVLARVRRSAGSALALLDGLARLARVGRKPMAARLVDVEELVRGAFAAERPAHHPVELTVVEPLPPIVGDPELLRIAFGELIDNAVKFTAGRAKATVTVGARADGHGGVEYWVADDGVGFDPRFAGKLFHVFERLHSRDEFAGAGAGLAVVRRVAERHGGRVRAEGEPQGGATFRLVLPLVEAGAPS